MLRKRKNKRYNEETNDEEDEGGRKFNIQEQIRSKRFDQDKERHLQDLSGDSITLKLIQKNGFEKPILVKEPDGLDLNVPPRNFMVRDVRDYVGQDRIIDVMDVRTQKNIEMSMKEWCKYYESKNRDRLLNVISLEFSHTELDDLVEAPMIVRLLDWVDLVWPKFLKQLQTESTNSIDRMKYPKVQKYCLMSVKGSYTDFHIDFGGTSVWYHIIKGKKIFWMVPPTELNLQTFEEWTLSGMQQDVFFGDTVEECFRVELVAGNTFFIPSGWIHAVYTLEDSLVFGGNFLHSFGIENQLRVSRIEDATKVPVKFRYPFYTEILWYVVQHYVHCLTGQDHLHQPKLSASSNDLEIKASSKVAASAKKTCNKNRDDDDEEEDDDGETTESELTESDTKRKGKKQAVKRTKRSKKPVKKKSQKPASTDDDDESTEIDSAYEDDSKQAEKKSNANTCRMTKNSLSRLQYEIEEQNYQKQLQLSLEASNSEKKKSKIESAPPKNDSKVDGSTTHQLSQPKQIQPKTSTTSASTINAPSSTSDATATQDSSKLNGWSSNQTSWSNQESEPKEPAKIHITRIELNGLKALVKYLSKLSGAKKNLPALIRNSRVLLDDCRKLIAEHENDDPALAITGKPITTELLNQKKTSINDLIDQFFKPSETTESDSSVNNPSHHTASLKSDSMTLTQQHRLKLNINIDDKKQSVSNTVNGGDGASSSPKSSPHKETKCLSPTKKLSNPTSVPFSSSSTATTTAAAPRPKSPPTRPLSNNQYTSSRTKQPAANNTNLLLPGSFADLIAATSTEKKVFEVSSSEVTSSIFGMKEPIRARTGSTSSTASKSSPTKDGQKSGSISALSVSTKPTPSHDQDIKTATNHSHTSEQVKKMTQTQQQNSPEPPKTNPQKRFINPAFRPQVKEKLIFASAPYVSPVSALDQSRSNNLYPWQSPAVPPQPQHTHAIPQQHSQRTTTANVTGDVSSTPQIIKSTNFERSSSIDGPGHSSHQMSPKKDSNSNQINQLPPPVSVHQIRPTTGQLPTNPNVTKELPVSGKNDQQPITSQIKSTTPTIKAERVVKAAPATEKPKATEVSVVVQPSPKLPVSADKNTDGETSKATININGSGEQIPKPKKPRGPPKKSKEARQVLDASDEPPKTIIFSYDKTPVQPMVPTHSVVVESKEKPDKPKVKRAKKPKNINPPADPSASNQAQLPQSTSVTSAQLQPRPPVICGLVAPPMNTSANQTQIRPQQYLISRPLMYNGLPTFSPSQFQPISRAHMPMITTSSIPSSLSFPTMQQGARIVWATQPPKAGSTTPAARSAQTTTVASAQLPKYGLVTAPRFQANPSTSATQPDNAALLSLATTALSTAPMSSTPTLSHVGIRQPTAASQAAIMVSSAGSQPTLFSGQQLYTSLMAQRMPMTQFVAQRPGAPRPQGQLVFARLPNQGQPRYLITQPGFIAQRNQTPLLAGQQPGPTLAFAAYRQPLPTPPTVQNPTKPMKSKKVKTH